MEEKIRLVMSLPPFNKMGLEKNIKNQGVKFIDLSSAFKEIINTSKKNIVISSPFLEVAGIRDIIELILKRAYEKVEIKILVRETFEYDNKRRRDILDLLNKIKKLGLQDYVQIRDYHYSKKPLVYSSIHAKFIVSDHKYAYLGSGELRKNSIEKNFEVGILTEGQIASDLSKIFNKLWEVSGEVKKNER